MDTPFRMYTYTNKLLLECGEEVQDMQTYVYIPLLNTGNVNNINSRNIDIISFFKAEVEKITGFSSDISIMGDTDIGLSLEDYNEMPPMIQQKSFSLESLLLKW